MQFPELVKRKCVGKGCNRTWRAAVMSQWDYCSRRCAIEDGRLGKNQEYRDYVNHTFDFEMAVKNKGTKKPLPQKVER